MLRFFLNLKSYLRMAIFHFSFDQNYTPTLKFCVSPAGNNNLFYFMLSFVNFAIIVSQREAIFVLQSNLSQYDIASLRKIQNKRYLMLDL